jgi:hypothetical protein
MPVNGWKLKLQREVEKKLKEGISKDTTSLPLCGSTPPYQGGES